MLEPFETWLQSAIAVSRNELGQSWQDLYLVSPIWRFWIGADVAVRHAPARLESVDSVGRFFPLAIIYFAEPGEELATPPFDPQDIWYFTIEERLLSVLDPEKNVVVERLMEGLSAPQTNMRAPSPWPTRFKRGSVWRSDGGRQAKCCRY